MDNRWFILFAAGLGIIVAAGLWGSSYYNKQILVVETPLFQPLPGAATMPPKVKRSLMVKIPAVVTTLLLAPSYMAFSSTGDAPDAEPTWAERRLGEGLMQFYGLFQGLTGAERNSAAATFLEFAAHDGDTAPLQDHQIEALFSTLLTTLHRAVPRVWLSATSKLLWCLYPSDIVIYDDLYGDHLL
jgi:hypothetical protein